ncbi:MAG: hypothetical protein IJY15_03715 [Thermoguttaceae bacterium]|nr:hypothetical protein [Thermoguttaceae bacterium]
MPQLLKFLRYFFLGRAQRVFCAQALTGLLLFGFGASVWTSLRTEICEQDVYIVKESDFCVWDPPIWISDRFIAEALELRAPEARTEELNSLDPNLVDNLLIAFESHPWVEKVESIEVRFPARVDVKLKYREPVAVVDPTPSSAVDLSDSSTPVFSADWKDGGENGGKEENGGNRENGEKNAASRTGEKYIVYEKGYRLPDEYFRNNPTAYRDFPVVLGIQSTPVSGFGQCVDPLVIEAAAFARFLAERKAFETLGIDRIVVAKIKGETNGFYRLKTKGNAVVCWGRFGTEKANEGAASASGDETAAFQEAKIERLLQLAAKYSSLEAAPTDANGELDLTVRTPLENGERGAAFDDERNGEN